MKLIVIGDPHFKSRDAVLGQEFALNTLKHVKEYSPQGVVVLGDVLHNHERLHTQSLNMAVNWIQSLCKLVKDVYVLVGNHDYINNSQFLSTHHWMNALKNWEGLHIIDTPLFKDGIGYCPYVSPGKFIEALKTQGETWKECRVIFCHQEFKGCVMRSHVSEVGDEWKEEYPLVVSGHIHGKQWIGKNVYYTGSPYQQNFGESPNKTIVLIVLFKNLLLTRKN